jgi:uncharacterized protein YprB with RNaseH-like and TPR domain
MPIDDEFKLIRKQRASRPRGRTVEDAWSRIDADDGLSTKDKLQNLIALTIDKDHGRTPGTGRGGSRQAPAAPAQLLRIFENPYPLHVRYGRISIADGLQLDRDLVAKLVRGSSREDEPEEFDLSRALFIDLETTGLAGGTGTLPFLVGMGFYRNDRFQVVQHFLEDPAGEGVFIAGLRRFFEEMDFRSIVTYNGKLFDMPLLETRFILNRTPFPLAELPHLDFLFSARILWKHKHESCRLSHLAREVVQADRLEDIPSAEIPVRYFQYLRTRDFSLIEPILYHNQEDILSLLGVVISGFQLIAEAENSAAEGAPADAMDIYGAGKFFERTGDAETSIRYYERALRGRLSRDTAAAARQRLSTHFKKAKKFDRAVALWREMTEADQLSSFRELAIHYEHRDKNLELALSVSEEGLALAMEEAAVSIREDFRHRIERLKAKLRRASAPRPVKGRTK